MSDPGTTQLSVLRRVTGVTGNTSIALGGMIEETWSFLLEKKRLKGI